MKKLKVPGRKAFTALYGKQQEVDYVREAVDSCAYDIYREMWARTERLEFIPDFPLQLDFELNYSCNFSCINCTWSIEATGGKGKNTWFPFEVFQEVIDQAVPKGLKAVRLNYINEPLIRKDIVKYIEYARKAGILDVYFSTNGSLLSEAMSKALIDAGLLRLQVSIDAATKETFDKIRVGGNFAAIKRNIERFLLIREKLGTNLPTVRLNFVKSPENMHELQEFIDFWSGKVDGIGIQDLIGILDRTGKQNLDASPETFNCNQPFNHLTIRYDGEILPCCSFFGSEIPIAKLQSLTQLSEVDNIGLLDKKKKSSLILRTIEEAWHSNEMNYFREIHQKGEYWRHPVCKKCVLSSSHSDESQ